MECSCKLVLGVLGEGLKTLGKRFIECYTRQTLHDRHPFGKAHFTELFLSVIRLIVCRVSDDDTRQNKVVWRVANGNGVCHVANKVCWVPRVDSRQR